MTYVQHNYLGIASARTNAICLLKRKNMKLEQSTKILSTLVFSIVIILSSDIFAEKLAPISSSTYVIGKTGPGGGIIFQVGGDGKHGLEVAKKDQSAGVQWYNGTFKDTMAVKTGLGDGSFNTDRIITTLGKGNYAALLCANYNGGGYGDWYLPSKDELNLIYNNLHLKGLGGFVGDRYWSSSEDSSGNGFVWHQKFSNGYQFADDQFNLESSVRAVRAF